MKKLIAILLFSLTLVAQARVDALFHPQGKTLETIAQWISEAHESVDIAMYNMETQKGPIIKMLKSEFVSKRIANNDLRIRLIFEGYGTKVENEAKMAELEALGIDVRFLGNVRKIHHKFAVIDGGVRLITGSANWSLNSQQNYHENILFIEDEGPISSRFLSEFETLWSESKEFGVDLNHSSYEVNEESLDRDLSVHFNSNERLTDIIVSAIHNAKRSIKIATTRIKIGEVAQALIDAQMRGVDIQIVVSMDEYKCSPGKSYSRVLSKRVDLRVKIYNLAPCEYMKNQMHNKYMIVDNESLYTGSFNWSQSSEKNHFENLVVVEASRHPKLVETYRNNFKTIWNFNRESWSEEAVVNGHRCDFPPTSLSFSEIDSLYKKRSCR